MKLIIDIDDKEKAICEQYINGKLSDELGDHVNITELADAIADGTPYESKGDLISRSAVLEKLMEHQYSKDFCIEHGIEQSIHIGMVRIIIDNAPTAEVKGLPKIHYDRGFIAGYEKGKAERPIGEWAEFEGGYRCSNCDDIEVYTPNFCPNCGAKMKDDTDNDSCETCMHQKQPGYCEPKNKKLYGFCGNFIHLDNADLLPRIYKCPKCLYLFNGRYEPDKCPKCGATVKKGDNE